MVVGAEQKANPADVVLVVEATANLSAYIDVLKKYYIIPSLEVFNGGPPDPTDIGHDYSCSLYNLVTFFSADVIPDTTSRCSGVTTNIHEFITWLDDLPLIGGGGESCSHITEGLSTALHVFDDLQKVRIDIGLPVQRHCILVCNSPPYNLPSQEGVRYVGYMADQLASMMAKRGIHLSIISPRKIPALQKLYEESTLPTDMSAPVKDFTTDPRHLVLLHGFQLEERAHSPAGDHVNIEKPAENKNPSSPAPPSFAPSTGFSPAPSLSEDSTEFKKPNTTSGGTPFGTQDSIVSSMPSLPSPQQPQMSQPSPSQGISMQHSPAMPPMQQNPPQQQPQQQPMVSQPQVTNQMPPQSQYDPMKMNMMPNDMQNRSTAMATNPINQPVFSQPTMDQQPNVNMPAQPGQPNQMKDRKIIWQGILEWQEKMKAGGPQTPKVNRQLQCHLSIGQADPDINAMNWPKVLIMQLIPQSLLNSTQLQPLFKNSRQVAFHFGSQNLDDLRNLYKVMGTGFAGCVHFPAGSQCEVRVLLLLFSNKRRAFIGLIPNDQTAFVNGIRSVIYSHKIRQQQQQQRPDQQPQMPQQTGFPGPQQTMPNQPVQNPQGAQFGVQQMPQVSMQNPMMTQQQANMQKQMQATQIAKQQEQQKLLAQQRLQQQRQLQMQQMQQQQQQQQQPGLNNQQQQQLTQLLMQQQQQGQRQPQMIITQGRGGQILHQGHQQVMGGGQVLQGNMPQMAQQGPSSAPQGGNMFDDLNMEFL
ncbi:mediator of RNA polymerase II transcription subunit 25-like isoform X2 [Crassostrea angulata]|uniref:mediator of RNA polymerase II transcription subunit 25-like isoform X2 n=1 Tax=Magallana angulata TaxID=2784310 RepID=UPI0022B0E525|nr:mediator of RNA polymerase II transcription subunit 25-like isoform X2 [Crassostrea angulata]